MVKEGAQLYTMEGIAAGLIMLLTTYLVLGSTSVYTPGDTHLTDMQLEQVGSDILRVMDTPLNLTNSLQPGQSSLQGWVNATDAASFYSNFTSVYFCRTNPPMPVAQGISVGCSDIQVNASIWYVNKSNSLQNYQLPNPNLGFYSSIGPGVRVTHWIQVNWTSAAAPKDARAEPEEVLLEVLMWKS